MKVIPDFENEIKLIDPRFSIVDNPNFKGLKNVFFEGRNFDLPPVPADEIKDEHDPGYYFTFPGGRTAPFHSRASVRERLIKFIGDLDNIRKLYD